MIWERCCTNLDEVLAAFDGKASRVELCQDLEVGGTTPPEGLILSSVEVASARDTSAQSVNTSAGRHAVNVLIRPRGGDFIYSEKEVASMIESIRFCRHRCDGVVIGALTQDGSIDMTVMQKLMSEAKAGGLSVTFHRAFDECRDPFVALEQIIGLGCDRLLTSGQAPVATEGQSLIASLVREARGRIIIMPGSGVTPDNVTALASATGAVEFHGTKLF